MADSTLTAGAAIFARLKKLGVDYVFCNSGTDFPPIIEGLASAAARNIDLPKALVIPHEHVAMGMAHGYYHATGRPQAVMLHTNVGLANGAIGAINAACEQIPMILMSGRTPITEKERFGARTVPIGWGQEMRDQTALVRETCKWDYELKYPEQIVELLDRAHAIAESTPKGPVYLSLPREVLCETINTDTLELPPIMAPARAGPCAEDIERLAGWISEAVRPLIIAQRGTGSPAGFERLANLVDEWGLPVCHYWANAIAIPTDHPMGIGDNPSPWIEDADLIVVIDSLAPWQPDKHRPHPKAKIVHLGPNPLQSRTPVRNFRSDLSITGETSEIIHRLADALDARRKHTGQIDKRRETVAGYAETVRGESLRHAEEGRWSPMSKAWVAQCLSDVIVAQDRKSSVVHELGCPLSNLTLRHSNAYRQEPYAGGLGYGLPAAMGIQLAEPDTLMFATVGDGSYMFANPTVCHQVCEALALPIITLVLNNQEWGAVRQSVSGLYPDGYANHANQMPLTALKPSPDFEKTAAASRAYTETIHSGEKLPEALQRAVQIATEERRHVLLNVAISSSE